MKKSRVLAGAAVLMMLFSASVFALTAEELKAKHRVKLWSFESGTTEGWSGAGKWKNACSAVKTKYATDGEYALKIDAKGSVDWNQDLALTSGPFPSGINRLVELTMDVYIPPASVEGLEYQEMYVVFSGKSNAWFQLKGAINPGKNTVVFKVDNTKIAEDMWNVYIVLNNSQPYKGSIYVDNIRGRVMGDPGKAAGQVKDKKTGEPVKDAYVVIGDVLSKTDGSGKFEMTVPEDVYKMEIVRYGYRKKTTSNVMIVSGKNNNLGVTEMLPEREPKTTPVKVNIDASKVLRGIDKHMLLGQNVAAWHKPEGYRDNLAIKRLKHIGATFIRVPGGDYGNLYDWRTGDVYRWDGTVNWTPEFNYTGGFTIFMRRMQGEMGGKMEVLPIINIMTPMQKSIDQRVDYAIEWIQDMKNKGMKVRFVEVGNEPDNKPKVPGPSAALKKGASMADLMKSPASPRVTRWWTSVKNYTTAFNWASYKIKKAFPKDNLQMMGPCPMQPMNQQRIEGEPWKAGPEDPHWVELFLKYARHPKGGSYVDVLAIHEYPLWANNDARALLRKPQETWPVYMPKYRAWMKKYLGKEIPVALTEWNSGDENIMTALIDNAIFCADYLGSYINEGGAMAFIWDLYTQKPGLGGGHGLMDSENDPTDSFSRRGHYWVFDLYYNRFGEKLIQTKSSDDQLSVYSSITKDGKIAIMAINKSSLRRAKATFTIKGKGVGGSGKAWTLSEKEYVWSKALYRPIINEGPSESNVPNTGSTFTYTFEPYTITVIQL